MVWLFGCLFVSWVCCFRWVGLGLGSVCVLGVCGFVGFWVLWIDVGLCGWVGGGFVSFVFCLFVIITRLLRLVMFGVLLCVG